MQNDSFSVDFWWQGWKGSAAPFHAEGYLAAGNTLRYVYTVADPLTGDYNADGIVDAADYVVWRNTDRTPGGYTAWRANFNQSVSRPGDFNRDGKIDAADYVVWRNTDGTSSGYGIWRANYGQLAAGESVVGARIPEPAVLWLSTIGGAIAYGRRRSPVRLLTR